jgi:K+-transporting ATPase KdpF subunit
MQVETLKFEMEWPEIPKTRWNLGISWRARLLLSRGSHGRGFHRCHDLLLRRRALVRVGVRKTMTPLETVLGLAMAIGLTVYLVYAILQAERF